MLFFMRRNHPCQIFIQIQETAHVLPWSFLVFLLPTNRWWDVYFTYSGGHYSKKHCILCWTPEQLSCAIVNYNFPLKLSCCLSIGHLISTRAFFIIDYIEFHNSLFISVQSSIESVIALINKLVKYFSNCNQTNYMICWLINQINHN